MLLEIMRTAFMRCMAELVNNEKILLMNRFQSGESSLLKSWERSEQGIASIRAKNYDRSKSSTV